MKLAVIGGGGVRSMFLAKSIAQKTAVGALSAYVSENELREMSEKVITTDYASGL